MVKIRFTQFNSFLKNFIMQEEVDTTSDLTIVEKSESLSRSQSKTFGPKGKASLPTVYESISYFIYFLILFCHFGNHFTRNGHQEGLLLGLFFISVLWNAFCIGNSQRKSGWILKRQCAFNMGNLLSIPFGNRGKNF